jgi:hypothetical protein
MVRACHRGVRLSSPDRRIRGADERRISDGRSPGGAGGTETRVLRRSGRNRSWGQALDRLLGRDLIVYMNQTYTRKGDTMSIKTRIATMAVAVGVLGAAVPVATAAAATIPSTVNAPMVATVAPTGQAAINTGLQAGLNGYETGIQAGLNGWQVGLQAAQGGFQAGAQAAQSGWAAGAQAAQSGWAAGAQAAQDGFNAGASALGLPAVGVGFGVQG